MPRVALSVDMLDTGIDIHEIVNLVFAKPVYSYTKFWQMIGRGTRLLEPAKIKPWCREKDAFLILDCWDNFDYFKLNPKGKETKQQIPLPVRFVGIRIDKIEKAIETGKEAIAEKETAKLKQQIAELPENSVIITEAAKDLAAIAEENYWTLLTHEKFEFLRTNIKPLFRTISQTDFKAMRFQKDVLETSLAKLADEKEKFETLKDNLVEQITELPLSVNIVAKEEVLIKEAQTNHYWAIAVDDTFDILAEKIAPLMKFRDSFAINAGPAKFDLSDVVKTKEFVEFGPEHSVVSVSKYREMVEKLIEELTHSNPILKRIKEGETIAESEIQQLAEILQEEHPHVTEDLLRNVYQNRKAKFIQFIRHILGLEILESYPVTVSKAFEQFIQNHSNLSTKQLDFLNIMKEFIIEREKVEKRDLIQAPFTIIHPQGIRGLFTPYEIDEILEFTERLVA